jgi:hypothetical protein
MGGALKYIVTYWVVHATNKTGSSSDDWIYKQLVTHPLLITLTYKSHSSLADLHHLQTTVAHALGFFLSTSHLLATDLDTQTATVSHSVYYT